MAKNAFAALAALCPATILVCSPTSGARELEDILLDKGVISEEEAKESLETKSGGKVPIHVHWDKSLRFESPDGNFQLKIGGRIMNDWAIFDEDDEIANFFGEDEDVEGPGGAVVGTRRVPQDFGAGTEFRRARLFMSGKIYKRAEYKAQYDFAGGAEFKDVWMGLNGMGPLGKIKVGHFKEPFSLEELTSSKYITFMERSLPNLFAPGRNTGIGFYNDALNERVTYGAGFFRDAGDFGEGFGENDDYNFTLRGTALPLYADGGRQLLHVGIAYSFQNRDTGFRYRERPEAHLSPVRFVDTGSFDADGANLLGVEAATVFGPFSVQAEYIGSFVDSASVGDPNLSAFYAYASFFLTGENRVYDTGDGAFGRITVNDNFLDGKGGMGAWEAAVRYSHADLSDGGLSGGELDDVTAGLNWHLNRNLRVMFNYVFADLDGVGEANILQTRFQVDF